MLDAVNATKVVLAIRTDGSTRFTMQRTTGVVMRDDGGIKIEDIHRAIRTERDVDRTEPMIHGTQPFAVLDCNFPQEGRTTRDQFFKVYDIENRLSGEDGIAILFWPSAMLLNGYGASGGVITDLVDLQERGAVRQVSTQDRTMRIDGTEGLGRRARGLGEDGFGQHDVLDGITVGRLAMEELHLARDFVAEAVATLRGDLLDS